MMQVTIGMNERTNYFTVHAPGCGHTERNHYSDVFSTDVASVKDLVDSCYGPERGSYYAEAGCDDDTGWIQYGGMDCLHVAPCARSLVKDLH